MWSIRDVLELGNLELRKLATDDTSGYALGLQHCRARQEDFEEGIAHTFVTKADLSQSKSEDHLVLFQKTVADLLVDSYEEFLDDDLQAALWVSLRDLVYVLVLVEHFEDCLHEVL